MLGSSTRRKQKYTCGMLLNRKTWSESVEPGKASPPMSMPTVKQDITQY